MRGMSTPPQITHQHHLVFNDEAGLERAGHKDTELGLFLPCPPGFHLKLFSRNSKQNMLLNLFLEDSKLSIFYSMNKR